MLEQLEHVHLSIAVDIFDINRTDNNAVDINKEESIDQTQDIHKRDEGSDAIVTLDINEQAAPCIPIQWQKKP